MAVVGGLVISFLTGVAAAGPPAARQDVEAVTDALPLHLPADIAQAATILAAEDRRELTDDLLRLTRVADEDTRARAALAVGRVGLPAGQVRLLELLRDPAPAVRALAAFALGLLELDLEPSTAPAHRSRIAAGLAERLADPDPGVIAQALWSLGALGEAGTAAAIAPLLTNTAVSESVLAAALDAWWRLPGASPGPLGAPLLAPSPAVRRAAATSLRRLGDPDALPLLAQALDDPDAGVRVEAIRGLHAAPPAVAEAHLVALLHEEDWRLVCAALDWAAAQWRADADLNEEVFTAVLRASADRNRHVQRQAFAALTAAPGRYSVPADRLAVALRSGDPTTRTAALAALAADPERAGDIVDAILAAYGLEAPVREAGVGELPDGLLVRPLEAAALTRVLGLVDDDAAGAWLRVLAAYGPEAARAEGLRQLRRRAPQEAASGALTLLSAGTPVLQAVAAEVVRELAAIGELPAAGADGVPWFDALWTVQREMGASGALEPRTIVLDALLSLDRARLRQRAEALLQDDDRIVRAWALRRLEPRERPGLDLVARASGPRATARTAEDYARLAERVLRLQEAPPRLTVETPRGDFVWELRVDAAPLAVLAYLDWVESGFFDGLVFHRVVPDFVIQAGDPTAIGYGGAPGSLPSEETPIPYTAGTVGLALAGRDTGGSQFFIVVSPQPHLTGRYPVLGRIVGNPGYVERVQPGDALSLHRR